jgi:hypothetical protein
MPLIMRFVLHAYKSLDHASYRLVVIYFKVTFDLKMDMPLFICLWR